MKTALKIFFLLVGLTTASVGMAQTQKVGADTTPIRPGKDTSSAGDENPVPPGGNEAYAKNIAARIVYPEKAIDANVSGTVYITLVIDKTGEISEISIKKDIGYGCGEEAMRVIKSLGAWKPGKIDGKPVKVRYTMPVKFKLIESPPFWSKWFKKKK